MSNKMLLAIVFMLSPCSISAQQVVFKCSLQNADRGWMIAASNPGHGPRTCTASCEAIQADGNLIAFGNCGPKSVRQGANSELFCGDENASKTPLKSPKISASSCN
jgi:hypothetical protein